MQKGIVVLLFLIVIGSGIALFSWRQKLRERREPSCPLKSPVEASIPIIQKEDAIRFLENELRNLESKHCQNEVLKNFLGAGNSYSLEAEGAYRDDDGSFCVYGYLNQEDRTRWIFRLDPAKGVTEVTSQSVTSRSKLLDDVYVLFEQGGIIKLPNGLQCPIPKTDRPRVKVMSVSTLAVTVRLEGDDSPYTFEFNPDGRLTGIWHLVP